MKRLYFPLALLAFTLIGCSDDPSDNGNNTDNGNGDIDYDASLVVDKLVTIDAGISYQTIEGFAASDAWSPETIGTRWTSSRDAISEALFSREIVDGQPRGIGLSMWRVNLGGGSAEQGDASGIEDQSRRAQSYLAADGTSYDWTKCAGQRYFLDRAREFGVEKIVLFSNTPLVQYTVNGRGYSANGANANLKDDCYDDFAEYMATVADHYLKQGYPVTHISPVNEPQYNWEGGQEGSGWQNSQIARLARELDKSLTARNLDVDILLGESGDFTYLYQTSNSAGSGRSNVIYNFFDEQSPNYVGDLAHVDQLVCGHSYWTDGTWKGMRDVRSKLANRASQYGIRVWQSEWSMLGDNYSSNEFVGFDAASDYDIAFYMAKVLHNDLTVANVSSWSYWTSMDVPRWGHKCRFVLIALGNGSNEYSIFTDPEVWKAAPTLWVLGNYSLFVRPGYHRISLDLTESSSFFGSAYASADGKRVVAVYTNLSKRPVRLVETRKNFLGDAAAVSCYVTAAGSNLAQHNVSADGSVVLVPESVTTVVYDLQ